MIVAARRAKNPKSESQFQAEGKIQATPGLELVEPETKNLKGAGGRPAFMVYNSRMIFRKKKRLTEMVDCAG
jgi:hypothetical protein